VQSGQFVFRYVLTSGNPLNSPDLGSLGRAEMTPLELGLLVDNDQFGNPDRPLTTAPTSFLNIDAANVTVDNWKVAEDGNGTIIRLLETGGIAAAAHLTLPLFNIEKAWLADAAEENQEELKVDGHSVEVSLKPHESVTLRILAPKMAH
jgi:alpha-mannosidase